MAGLSLTFWPNPVYRNHPAEKRWYFSAALHEIASQTVHIVRYRGEWYDLAGHCLDTKEESLDIHLRPLQHLAYADLWLTSAMIPFRYRLVVLGKNGQGQDVSTEGALLCQ